MRTKDNHSGNTTGNSDLYESAPQLRAANDLMRCGEYARAAAMYEQLLADGCFTSSLRVNLSVAQKRADAQGRSISANKSALVANQSEAARGQKTSERWINMTPDDWRSVSLRCQLGATLPVLSIVIPCYNSGRLLKDTLVRMIATRSVPFEVVIVDDGSTDGSFELLESVAERYANIRVMSQVHQGAGSARNLAIPHCKGLYSFFLDADDEMDMSEISKAVVHAIVNDRDLVFLAYRIFNDEARSCHPMYAEDDAVFQAAMQANDQKTRQRLACELTGFPWNRIVATALLQKQQILFCETQVHNDMLFHWQSIVLSQKMDFWQNAVCMHKKFSTGSLSSSRGKRRLEVFDAMRLTYERLQKNSVFRRNQDIWDRICQKTLNWNRGIIFSDVTGAFDAALQQFRQEAVIQHWESKGKAEGPSPAKKMARPARHQALEIPTRVREDACADMQKVFRSLDQETLGKVQLLIFSDSSDLPIEGQLCHEIIASTNHMLKNYIREKDLESKNGALKKLIALLRYDMREITR